MIECRCLECGWSGPSADLFNDFEEDSDGDLVGEHINACPDCHGDTEDVHPSDDGEEDE